MSLHFPDVRKIVKAGLLEKTVHDYELTRYACYLIAMNGDSRKQVIALAQTYFAVKTREQEITEQFNELSEDQKRLLIRENLKEHNISLAEAAHMAGVKPGAYGHFQNAGYKGLYGGLTTKDIHKRKELKTRQKILDHMGSTELADNLFRATQTDEKIRRENIKGAKLATQKHYDVGAVIRNTIKELVGTMPEDLPTQKKVLSNYNTLKKECKKRKIFNLTYIYTSIVPSNYKLGSES